MEQAIVDPEDAFMNLSKAKVVSPIDGVVIDVRRIGERASRNAIVSAVADATQLELTVNVAEIDVVKLAWQSAEIEIDAIPGRTFEGSSTTSRRRATRLPALCITR